MKRGLRIVALVLVACVMLGAVASAAGRTISGSGFGLRGTVSAKARTAAAVRLLAMIDKGIAINGVKNARPLVASTGSKATVTSFNLSPMSGVMSTSYWYAEGYTNLFSVAQPLMIQTSPADGTFNIDDIYSSDPNVVRISYDVFGTTDGDPWPALVTSTRTGTAKITVIINGRKATKNITVKNGLIYASSILLYAYDKAEDSYYKMPKKATIYTDETLDIAAIANPYNASFASDGSDLGGLNNGGWFMTVNCTSSKESVAVVTRNAGYDNYVFPVKPGSANITVKAADGGKASATLALTVKGIPVDSVELSATSISMQPGTTRELGYTVLPAEAWDKSVSWTTDNKKVATVDAKGNVTAVGRGSCTIKATNKASGESDTVSVKVSYKKSDTAETEYRFFGIGNSDYPGVDNDLPGCANDLAMMLEAYAEAGASTTPLSNRTAAQILTDLDAMATSGAGPEDVTIFYYSGHGAAYPTQGDRGALVGTDNNIVTVDQVQAKLDKVPGTVVVILDSCLSGQFITSKSASPAAKLAQAKDFNQAWISKFSRSKATNFSSKALTSSSVKSKYKILTAAAPMEVSWGGKLGWFSSWLGMGIGMYIDWDATTVEDLFDYDGYFRADANEDDAVTLVEAYNYVKTKVNSESNQRFRQTTSVWPANDKTAIFNAYD